MAPRVGHATVDVRIAAQPAPVRALLQPVRRTIHRAAPEATEAISCQIPTIEMHGKARRGG